jgi:hypothetical protein
MTIAKPTFPRLQRGHPLARGLVAAWAFHEGSGASLRDLSGRGNNGVLQNAPTWTAGKFGTALQFNGGTDAVSISGNLDLSAFTIGFWWKPAGLAAWSGPFNNRVAGKNGFQITNDQGSAPWKPHLVIWNGSAETAQYKASSYSLAVPAADWHYFVWSYDGATAKFYVDAVEQAVSSSAVAGYGATGIYLARGYGYVSGPMDATLIYNRALRAHEVARLYFDPFAMFRPPQALRPPAGAAHPYSFGYIFS